MSQEPQDRFTTLIDALADPVRFPGPPARVSRIETHISVVLLAGDDAYKIKKPLNLGFLDFSDLARRRAFCAAEVQLNRRLAPSLYLDSIAITGSAENPVLGGDPAEAIEFAVHMRRFPQEALLDRCLADGRLRAEHLDALAERLAAFHTDTAAPLPAASHFGSPETVAAPAFDNFRHTRELLADPADLARLERLEAWTRGAHAAAAPAIARRKAEGRVRECHGDLHLGNMILTEGGVEVFDCIEFNDEFRCIDTASDLAFLVMDLVQRGAEGWAWRLLNTYLEHGGDFGALEVLPFYLVYRAMVRAKVAAIRLHQPGLDAPAQAALLAECRSYLALAERFTQPRVPFLLLTHGVSGSGKSTATQAVLEAFGAIRLRSDVERKRLFGLAPRANSAAAVAGGIYTPAANARTYARLLELAGTVLALGWPVLVDATFPEAAHRAPFRALAAARGVPCVLLACHADPDQLRARVAARVATGNDAAEADLPVLERQLAAYTPPPADEHPLDARGLDTPSLLAALARRLADGG